MVTDGLYYSEEWNYGELEGRNVYRLAQRAGSAISVLCHDGVQEREDTSRRIRRNYVARGRSRCAVHIRINTIAISSCSDWHLEPNAARNSQSMHNGRAARFDDDDDKLSMQRVNVIFR